MTIDQCLLVRRPVLYSILSKVFTDFLFPPYYAVVPLGVFISVAFRRGLRYMSMKSANARTYQEITTREQKQ